MGKGTVMKNQKPLSFTLIELLVVPARFRGDMPLQNDER